MAEYVKSRLVKLTDNCDFKIISEGFSSHLLLRCTICQSISNQFFSLSSLIDEASELGWRQDRAHNVYCPECARC